MAFCKAVFVTCVYVCSVSYFYRLVSVLISSSDQNVVFLS